MQAPRDKAFGPARIVAIALISLTALGLAYLHFAQRYELGLRARRSARGTAQHALCHYATESGGYAADCGTLVVPENRHEAQSRLIALPVTRIRARSANPRAPIFRLQGGPGITNMTSPRQAVSPTSTTSSWSATAASTARRSSTAPR